MTVNLTLRATKGAALTHDEVDANFTSLKTNIEANYLALPFFKPSTGRYSTNSTNGAPVLNGTIFAANGMYLVPWFAPWDMVIDQIGINCATAVASATAKIVVYAADANGLPSGAPLFEGGDLDLSGTGYKSSAVSLTFSKGTKFWLAVRSSSTATISANQVYTSLSIDAGDTPVTTAPAKVIRRLGVTYANPAPSWVFAESEIVSAATFPAYTFWMREV